MTSQRERAEILRRLHTDEQILVLINVWDVASATTIAALPQTHALATASAAVSAAYGYDDGENVPLPLVVDTVRRICAATDLPVTVDLEAGYGDLLASVGQVLEAGAVGVNIEDAMAPIDDMVQRITAARAAGERAGVELVINARTDVYLAPSDWDEERKLESAVSRGLRYLEAGADCVFVPALVQENSIRELASAFGGRLSVLWVPGLADAARLQSWGVARVSHGPFAQRAALQALAGYAESNA